MADQAVEDISWPGVAPPAGWFLRGSQSPLSSARETAPETAPENATETARETAPEAGHSRAGDPAFQPNRARPPAPPDAVSQNAAGLSLWQRSRQLWTEAGIQWEQCRDKQPQPYPRQARPPSADASDQATVGWPGQMRVPRPGHMRVPRPGQMHIQRSGTMPVPLGAPVSSDPDPDEDDGPVREGRGGDDHGPVREHRWGADVRADPWDNEDREDRRDDAIREDPRGQYIQQDEWADEERWDDERPLIWELGDGPAPPLAPGALNQPQANDTLLLDHAMPGSGRPGPGGRGRRPATMVVPAVVLVAVAVLALALLTGHGPRFGPLTSDQHKRPKNIEPQLSLAAVNLDTYPGQQVRGVFQTVNRVAAVGNTMVTIGSQTSDGLVRQQFLVSTNAGASWRLAPVRAPGGGLGAQPALDHPAALLAGGPGGWLAVGPQAIWTSRDGLTWTLAAAHGISPQLPGDSVWVITKTADGFLAAGAGAGTGTSAGRGATQAVIWTSRDGLTWQRMTAAQLSLAPPGETVQNISYATWRGDATVISGTVIANTGAGGGTPYDAAWLSNNDGSAWTRVAIPADHGAGAEISGLGFDGSGFIAVRPGRTASGAADGVAYFSPDGQAWRYSASIDPAGGWSPGVVKGSDYGFVVTGATAGGELMAYTSSGTGTAWLPTGPLGDAATESVVGATVAPASTIIAIGYTAVSKVGQQPVFLEANTAGSVRTVSLAGIAGAIIPEMAIHSTAAAGGMQIAVGSANGYPAVWRKTSGADWTLVSSPALLAADPHLRALTSVTHGPAGWLAVGAPGPVVLTSTDGTAWGVAGGNITRDLAGVSAVAAASGPAGYVIVGKLVAPGGGCVADVWWSPNLTSWTRAHDVNDVTGSSQVLAIAADSRGFVSVGSHDGQPAVWMTGNGRSWQTIVLPVPGNGDGEPGWTAVLQQVAINGSNVVALGQVSNGAGAGAGMVPFAELSADGGRDWRQVPFSSPGPDTVFTALTPDAAGFTAAGLFGPPGQQGVAVWMSATGVSWRPWQSSQLNGSGTWQIDALTASGSAVTGIGSIATQQSQQTVTFTLSGR